MATLLSGPGGTSISIRQISGVDEYSSDNGASWASFSYPVLMSNTDTSAGILTVLFTTDITITSGSGVFQTASSDIQFGSSNLNADGSRPIITISGVTGYSGFIANGTIGADGFANVSIYNLVINSVGSTLGSSSGWVTANYFAKGVANNLISNCSTNGAITSNSGGICGSSVARGGILTIQNCNTSGTIATGGGGIVGNAAATTSGSTITVINCSSTGSIGSNGGGIFGTNCGLTGSTVIVRNCYSTGTIGGQAGGIFGRFIRGSVSAINCYSTGNMSTSAGGIYGNSAGVIGSLLTAVNCYSTGNMSNAGGIYGSTFYASGTTAYNCYTTGLLTAGGPGGIWYGSSSDTLQGTNNYSEVNNGSSGWNDTNARKYLQGAPTSSPIGTTWMQLNGANTPYILAESGYSPYSITPGTSTSSTIAPGETTAPAIVPNYTFSLLAVDSTYASSYPTLTLGTITIDATTGALSVDASDPGGTRTILIYSFINPYSITTYTLAVSGGSNIIVESAITTEGVSCCALPIDIGKDVDYETRNKFATGNTMIGGVQNRSPYASYTMFLYKQMAFASKR